VDTRLPRPRWRTTLDFRLSPTLQAGIEINPGAEEVGFRGNWFAVRETPRLPAVVFGTSSDRIGTPSGYQSYFVTFSKQFENLPIAPYISLNYSEFERGMTFPFGVSLSLGREWLLMPMYDGHASHTVLTWSGRSESIGLVLAWNRQFGITFSYGF
jgi:hypothetical protein